MDSNIKQLGIAKLANCKESRNLCRSHIKDVVNSCRHLSCPIFVICVPALIACEFSLILNTDLCYCYLCNLCGIIELSSDAPSIYLPSQPPSPF